MQVEVDKTIKLAVPDNLSTKNLERYYSQLSILLDNKPAEIEVDCSQLQRATSSHINVLWDTRYSCNEADVQMRLVSISDGLEQVLRVLDLYVLMVGHEDPELPKQESRVQLAIDKDNNVLEMELGVTCDSISSSIVRIKDFLGKSNLDKLSILEIETIFYEISSNIRLHAQIEDKNLIHLNASLYDDKIVLKFVYPGILFDPTARVKNYDVGAVIKQRQKRGYGLIMINRMADEISYNRSADDLNELNIVKYWRGSND